MKKLVKKRYKMQQDEEDGEKERKREDFRRKYEMMEKKFGSG